MTPPGLVARGLRRARELALDASLAATTTTALLAEDPLLTVLQVGRRLPPGGLRLLVRALGAPGPARAARGVLAAWLADRPQEAVAALEAAAASGPGHRGRALLAEVATQLRRDDLADRLAPGRAAASRARGRWAGGDLREALRLLDGAGPAGDGRAAAALRVRWHDELRLLAPGEGLRAPARARAHGPGPGPDRPRGAVTAQVRPSGPAVLHVLTNSLPHTQSGYSLRSQAVLAAQRDAGVRVAAVTRVGYPVSVGRLTARHLDVVAGVPYRRLAPARLARTTGGRLQQQVDLLVPLVRRSRPDVLHTTTDWTNGLVTDAVARATGLPWVYEVRGLLEETWVASQPPHRRERAATGERYRLLRDKETEVAGLADHVVTLSRTLRDELVGRGLPADGVTVVPNSVDPALLRPGPPPAAAREAAGLPRAGYWVGTVSSIVDYEGLDTLVDAVVRLRGDGVDARLLVVGDGVARPALEARARAAGLGADVAVLTGRVPPASAAGYHRALDVFVVPRRDLRVCRYVSPLKPVEAMAVGRPVVASDLPVLAELVAEPGSGLLARPDDPDDLAAVLGRLHAQPALREDLGAAGRRFAATRTWRHAGTRYRALYERLAA